MKRAIYAFVILGLLTTQARAEIMAASSIEWLTCQAEVIVVGKITQMMTTTGKHAGTYKDCYVEIDEVIKGKVKGKEIMFFQRPLPPNLPVAELAKSKHKLILFLSKSTGRGPSHYIGRKYVLTSRRFPLSAFDLTNLPPDAYSKDMTIIKDPQKLLKIVRHWAKSKITNSINADVPYESKIHKQLYSGSSCFLIVPAEEKFRAHFMKMAGSKEPHERARAASELYKFPGKETERVLIKLLQDKTESFGHSSADTLVRVIYSVRAAAYRSLRRLGKKVAAIDLERKPTKQEQVSVRQSYWKKSFETALTDGWQVSEVKDGKARKAAGRDTVAVLVSCSKGKSSCKFMLVPKEWDKKNWPSEENLGINGINNQGARYFFLRGALPEPVKQKLVKYFGLETAGAKP
jgi:hypothetical protein